MRLKLLLGSQLALLLLAGGLYLSSREGRPSADSKTSETPVVPANTEPDEVTRELLRIHEQYNRQGLAADFMRHIAAGDFAESFKLLPLELRTAWTEARFTEDWQDIVRQAGDGWKPTTIETFSGQTPRGPFERVVYKLSSSWKSAASAEFVTIQSGRTDEETSLASLLIRLPVETLPPAASAATEKFVAGLIQRKFDSLTEMFVPAARTPIHRPLLERLAPLAGGSASATSRSYFRLCRNSVWYSSARLTPPDDPATFLEIVMTEDEEPARLVNLQYKVRRETLGEPPEGVARVTANDGSRTAARLEGPSPNTEDPLTEELLANAREAFLRNAGGSAGANLSMYASMQSFLQLISDNDFPAAWKMLSPELQTAWPQEQFRQDWESVRSQLGERWSPVPSGWSIGASPAGPVERGNFLLDKSLGSIPAVELDFQQLATGPRLIQVQIRAAWPDRFPPAEHAAALKFARLIAGEQLEEAVAMIAPSGRRPTTEATLQDATALVRSCLDNESGWQKFRYLHSGGWYSAVRLSQPAEPIASFEFILEEQNGDIRVADILLRTTAGSPDSGRTPSGIEAPKSTPDTGPAAEPAANSPE